MLLKVPWKCTFNYLKNVGLAQFRLRGRQLSPLPGLNVCFCDLWRTHLRPQHSLNFAKKKKKYENDYLRTHTVRRRRCVGHLRNYHIASFLFLLENMIRPGSHPLRYPKRWELIKQRLFQLPSTMCVICACLFMTMHLGMYDVISWRDSLLGCNNESEGQRQHQLAGTVLLIDE